jgi:hypothetical protein
VLAGFGSIDQNDILSECNFFFAIPNGIVKVVYIFDITLFLWDRVTATIHPLFVDHTSENCVSIHICSPYQVHLIEKVSCCSLLCYFVSVGHVVNVM